MPKGQATASRICYRKELSRNIQIHQKRLAQIAQRKKGSGTLDNKPPKTSKMRHLKRNRKQEQIEEERFRESHSLRLYFTRLQGSLATYAFH